MDKSLAVWDIEDVYVDKDRHTGSRKKDVVTQHSNFTIVFSDKDMAVGLGYVTV